MPSILLSIAFLFVLSLGFVGVRFWLSRQPDELTARYRALGVLVWVTGATTIFGGVAALLFPQLAPTRPIGFFSVFVLCIALAQRPSLARRMAQRAVQ